jgi:uncharacterized protein YciW
VFLEETLESPHSAAKYQEDIDQDGFVWTLTELWAWNPEADAKVGDRLARAAEDAGLSFRDRGVIVTAAASEIENSGCAPAWGNRLSTSTDVETAVGVINGVETETMTARDKALGRWARLVAGNPASTTPRDVEALRDIGFDDRGIFDLTLYIALRVGSSTLNDALNASLDGQLVKRFPRDVVKAIDFGRPPV